MKKLPKKEAEKLIEEFFLDIENKTPKEIKKIKKLAMKYNIKLGDKRKLFCKKCFSPYKMPSIKIKKGILSITCENCDHVSRWKIK